MSFIKRRCGKSVGDVKIIQTKPMELEFPKEGEIDMTPPKKEISSMDKQQEGKSKCKYCKR